MRAIDAGHSGATVALVIWQARAGQPLTVEQFAVDAAADDTALLQLARFGRGSGNLGDARRFALMAARAGHRGALADLVV